MRHTDVETRYIQDETLSMGNTEGEDTVEVRRDERGTEDERHVEDERHTHGETH